MDLNRIIIIFFLLSSSYSLLQGQCQNVSFTLNSVTISDNTSCPGGNGQVTINMDGAISGGNPSLCVGYIPAGGTVSDFINVACFNKNGSGLPFDDVDVTFSVPCNADAVGISGWSSIGGGGNQCSNPAPVTSGNPLPITLISFSGVLEKDNQINLAWQTASEVNNDYFSIERSSNGIQFAGIGTVRGNGTSNRLNSYSFRDNSPRSGLNYYRLVQYDFDGQNSTSEIIVIKNLSIEEPQIIASNNRIKIISPNNNLNLRIVTFGGIIVKQFDAIPDVDYHLDDLDSGFYIVHLTTNEGLHAKKIFIR